LFEIGEVISDGFRKEYLSLNEADYYDSQILGPITCLFDGTTYNDEPALVGFRAAKAALDWQGWADNEYFKNFSYLSFLKFKIKTLKTAKTK
jgi:hypothetical protein